MDVTNSPPIPLNVSENTAITETTTQLTATTTINSTAPPIPRARRRVQTSVRPRQDRIYLDARKKLHVKGVCAAEKKKIRNTRRRTSY